MSEGQGGDPGGEGGGDGGAAAAAAAAAAAGGNGGGDGGGGVPEWLAGLPDDLKGDATLGRYKTLEEATRAHLEARKAVGAPKLPGADTALENFEAFAAVRPADAAAYEIDVPEGYPTEYADGFRAVAYEVGLHPSQVAKIVAFNNGALAKQREEAKDAADGEVADFKSELTAKGGDFDAQMHHVAAMLETHGLGDMDATMAALDGLQAQVGAKDVLTLLTGLASKFGEPAIPPGAGGGSEGGGNLDAMTVDQIKAVRTSKMTDAAWLSKAQTANTPENAEYNRLVDAEVRAEARKNRA